MALHAPDTSPVLLRSREGGDGDACTRPVVFTDGSPALDTVVDFLPLRVVGRLRGVSKEAAALLRACTLAGHVVREEVPRMDNPRRLSALYSCFPSVVKVTIHPTPAWVVGDFVAASRFRAVGLDSYRCPLPLPAPLLQPLTGKVVSVALKDCIVTDEGLGMLAGADRVVLNVCEQITDVGVASLVGVQDLSLYNMPALTGACLAPLAASLRALRVSGCSGITQLPLLSQLEKLQLGLVYPDLASSVPNLRTLTGFCVADLSSLDLPAFPHLRVLRLHSCKLSDAFMASIPVWVQDIELSGMMTFDAACLSHLRHARALTLMELYVPEGKRLVADDFTGFHKLEELDVHGVDVDQSEDHRIDLTGALVHTPDLKQLTMRPGQFSLTDLLQLHKLEKLRIRCFLSDGYHEEEDEQPLDLDAARALATLPFLRPTLSTFELRGSLIHGEWALAFEAALTAVCVPGSGLSYTKLPINEKLFINTGVSYTLTRGGQ